MKQRVMIIFCCKITWISLHTYVLLRITYSKCGYIYDTHTKLRFFCFKMEVDLNGISTHDLPLNTRILFKPRLKMGCSRAVMACIYLFIYLCIYLFIYLFIHFLQARRNQVAEGLQSPRLLSSLIFFRLKQIMKR